MLGISESELENGSKLKVINAGRSVSITCWGGGGCMQGCISVDQTDWHDGKWLEGVWWLCRLLIQRPYRNQGFGAALMKRLQEELLQQADFKVLIVAPGGYDSDPLRLFEFYRRQGFKDREDGTLEWSRP